LDNLPKPLFLMTKLAIAVYKTKRIYFDEQNSDQNKL
jgi:hypothetical protein